ncbi:MAG: TonB-dependent receptor, partial [Salibacteraceae bacterium]|nr:TonB-dependent receptor [Salibacteraceae bacterium]MDP4764078.1 TonB-dependent receptor [Salibacteraceae bacterium]
MKSIFGLLLFSLIATSSFAQKFTISGYVKDGETGEGMIAATVLVKELKSGTTTNEYGFYSLSLEKGTYTIEWSFIGFETASEVITLDKNITRSVEISFGAQLLNEVEITGEREDEALTTIEMSVEKLDIAQIKKIPALLGEADIIRTIQLLPGVTTVGEGATGFNVRGGNIDQNLILLDESPVFSSSHLFGFFSVFNADAIKDTKLYKGGIPAKYGGRLSSVLDIRQKEGNLKKFTGTGGVGLLFSRLTLEGPIVKDKISFIASGRRSYFDLFFPLAGNETIKDSRLYFYDLNGKINWTINDKNRVFLAGYMGDDVFNFSGLFNTRWGNRTGTVRWNHLFSDKIFAN